MRTTIFPLRRRALVAFAAATAGAVVACNGILGTIDLEYAGADAAADAQPNVATDATATDATVTDAATPPGDDSMGDGSLGDSTTRMDDAAVDATVDAGDAGSLDASDDASDSAVPPLACPYDGGCPCNTASCQPTLVDSLAQDRQFFATDAQNLYLTDNSLSVDAIPLDGGARHHLYTSTDPNAQLGGLALIPGGIVFVELNGAFGNIKRIARTGGSATLVFHDTQQSGQPSQEAIAASSARVYWYDLNTTLRSVQTDGGSPLSLVGANAGDGVTVNATEVYFSDGYVVGRTRLDFAGGEQASIAAKNGNSLVSDDASVYYSPDTNGVYRAPVGFPTDGGTKIATGTGVYTIVMGDDGFLYFSDSDVTSIYRCAKPTCAGGQLKLADFADIDTIVAVANGYAYYYSTDSVLKRFPLH
jgi:hypothetical protein